MLLAAHEIEASTPPVNVAVSGANDRGGERQGAALQPDADARSIKASP